MRAAKARSVKRKGKDPKAEVIEAQSHLREAFNKRDVRKIKALLVASGYVHTDVWGNVFDRNGWLKWLADTKESAIRRDSSNRVDEVRVQVFGDIAILTCLWTFRAASGQTFRARLINVWVRGRGRWRRLSYQATPVGSIPFGPVATRNQR